ncbi:ribose-phosphate diphosphokinase [Aquimarina rhabdastrellae]
MQYLHLDSDFTPFKTSINFEHFVFNGGEPHIKILEEVLSDHICITHRIQSFNDVGLILIATDALQRMGVKKIELFIPYFPAARQDRIMTKGEALSVKVYADIINAQGYDCVTIFDPHSEVTPALLNNVKVIDNHEFVKQAIKQLDGNRVLISPDGGALKKIYKVAQSIGEIEVIECSKQRDVKTGELSGFKVYEDSLEGKHCVIVDDICDGGGTFLGLAKELKKKGAKEISLIVSHGIFSRGYEALSEHFGHIITTNSFRDIEDQKIQQIKL